MPPAQVRPTKVYCDLFWQVVGADRRVLPLQSQWDLRVHYGKTYCFEGPVSSELIGCWGGVLGQFQPADLCAVDLRKQFSPLGVLIFNAAAEHD